MEDQEILAKNKVNGTNRTSGSSIGGGGLEWGGWLEFVDQGERITNPALVFLADMFINTPDLLPKSERIGLPSRLTFSKIIGRYAWILTFYFAAGTQL